MHKRNPVFRIPFVSDVSVCFQKLLGKFFHRIRLSVNGYLLGHQVEVVLPEHDFVLRNLRGQAAVGVHRLAVIFCIIIGKRIFVFDCRRVYFSVRIGIS